MSLVKWEPFDEFDRIFRDFGMMTNQRNQKVGLDLAIDMYDDGNNLLAEMNLPGLKGEDISVEIVENHLHVSGKREELQEKKEKSHYAKEISRGSFERVVGLPNKIDVNKVEATYQNGVLKIVMPKIEETQDSRIKVKVT